MLTREAVPGLWLEAEGPREGGWLLKLRLSLDGWVEVTESLFSPLLALNTLFFFFFFFGGGLGRVVENFNNL